jgi:hypothetical protein
MKIKRKFDVVYMPEAREFLINIESKLRDKIKSLDTLVIATHGFLRKQTKLL